MIFSTIQGIQDAYDLLNGDRVVIYRDKDGVDHEVTVPPKDQIRIRTVGEMADYLLTAIEKNDPPVVR